MTLFAVSFVLLLMAVGLPLMLGGGSMFGHFLRHVFRARERPVPEHRFAGLRELSHDIRKHVQMVLRPLLAEGFRVAAVCCRHVMRGRDGAPLPSFQHSDVYLVNERTSEVVRLHAIGWFASLGSIAYDLAVLTPFADGTAVETCNGPAGHPYDPPPGRALSIFPDRVLFDDLYAQHRRAVALFAAESARPRITRTGFMDWLAAHREQTFAAEVVAGRMRFAGGCYRPTLAGALVYGWRDSLFGELVRKASLARATERRWAEAGADPRAQAGAE